MVIQGEQVDCVGSWEEREEGGCGFVTLSLCSWVRITGVTWALSDTGWCVCPYVLPLMTPDSGVEYTMYDTNSGAKAYIWGLPLTTSLLISVIICLSLLFVCFCNFFHLYFISCTWPVSEPMHPLCSSPRRLLELVEPVPPYIHKNNPPPTLLHNNTSPTTTPINRGQIPTKIENPPWQINNKNTTTW